jgi:hypothetical protein
MTNGGGPGISYVSGFPSVEEGCWDDATCWDEVERIVRSCNFRRRFTRGAKRGSTVWGKPGGQKGTQGERGVAERSGGSLNEPRLHCGSLLCVDDREILKESTRKEKRKEISCHFEGGPTRPPLEAGRKAEAGPNAATRDEMGRD